MATGRPLKVSLQEEALVERWRLGLGSRGGDVGGKAWTSVRLALAGARVWGGDCNRFERGKRCFPGLYRPARAACQGDGPLEAGHIWTEGVVV